MFLLILTPLKLINTELRKSQSGSQNFIYERSLSTHSAKTIATKMRFSGLSMNCLLPVHKELMVSTAIVSFDTLTLKFARIILCLLNVIKNWDLYFVWFFLNLISLVTHFYGIFKKHPMGNVEDHSSLVIEEALLHTMVTISDAYGADGIDVHRGKGG